MVPRCRLPPRRTPCPSAATQGVPGALLERPATAAIMARLGAVGPGVAARKCAVDRAAEEKEEQEGATQRLGGGSSSFTRFSTMPRTTRSMAKLGEEIDESLE